MLPFDLPWYRRLLGVAVVLGLAGGVYGLVYLGGTGAIIDFVFGEGDAAQWSGEWWWIPLVGLGGLLVTVLRKIWEIPDDIPGGVKIVESGRVDHTTAVKWVAIAAISAVTGASLGPSFALILLGGGLGAWIAERRWAEGRADEDYTLTGIAGGFGGAFTAPILGAFLVSELGPTPKARYVAAIIPQLIAASLGFIVFYSVVGRTFLDSYELPPYRFEIEHMAVGAALGVLAAVVMLVFIVVARLVKAVTRLVPNRYILGVAGGLAVGVIAVFLPLTLGAGQAQLGTVIDESATLGIGLLIAVVIFKMVAMVLSLEVGFMGGNVFPIIFIGGTAGTVVHLAVPGIPPALAVSCMLAAVPGSFLRAPVSMTLIASIAVGLRPQSVAPVVVAVITAYLLVAAAQYVWQQRHDDATDSSPA